MSDSTESTSIEGYREMILNSGKKLVKDHEIVQVLFERSLETFSKFTRKSEREEVIPFLNGKLLKLFRLVIG